MSEASSNVSPQSESHLNTVLVSLVLLKIFLQFANINRYGFFRDEFYYMACGNHLAWGYVDQPPLVALIAWLVKHTMGDSMFAVRLPCVLVARQSFTSRPGLRTSSAAACLRRGLRRRRWCSRRFISHLTVSTR